MRTFLILTILLVSAATAGAQSIPYDKSFNWKNLVPGAPSRHEYTPIGQELMDGYKKAAQNSASLVNMVGYSCDSISMVTLADPGPIATLTCNRSTSIYVVNPRATQKHRIVTCIQGC